MTYRKGSDMLLYVDTDGNGAYSLVGGVQNVRINRRRPEVDVSNQSSASKHRELLAGASIASWSISGSGVMDDAAPQSTIETYANENTHRNWRCVVPGGKTYTGLFHVSAYESNAQHGREIQFSVTLESAGLITITAS
jgi:TP901-1 family phage major tail protein